MGRGLKYKTLHKRFLKKPGDTVTLGAILEYSLFADQQTLLNFLVQKNIDVMSIGSSKHVHKKTLKKIDKLFEVLKQELKATQELMPTEQSSDQPQDQEMDHDLERKVLAIMASPAGSAIIQKTGRPKFFKTQGESFEVQESC